MTNSRRFAAGFIVLACAVTLLPRQAFAGPPLVCHPFQTGSAALLPWGPGPGWNTPARGYDVERLTADTLGLLTPEAPVLARMENMRRAVLYASRDRRVAGELLAAVFSRALTAAAEGRADRLAWFDAGYLVETFRHARHAFEWNMLSPAERATWRLGATPDDLDGYAMVRKALTLGPPSPDMEFAASLMTQGEVSRAHSGRARAAAPEGSLLARNLQSLQ